MLVSKTTGHFTDYDGFIDMDPEAGTVKAIEATIKTASVNTNHQKRDAHLRNPDFFDVENHPLMTYRMKRYTKTADGYQAVGDLTLRGVTQEITLTGDFNGVAKDPSGSIRAGFNAEGKLNRKDFGMIWSKALDGGGFVVGDEVFIKLDVECTKAKR
jgi:polyisoprenoid-binding protein YceI